MKRTTRRFLALSVVFALAGCVDPYAPYYYYAAPTPPPLQPYMGEPIAVAPAPAKRVRHYAKKRHPRVHCRCTPVH
jgi:hypothetical protein